MRTLRSILLLAVSVVLLGPGPALAQSDDLDFMVTPPPGSDTAPQGGYFMLEAEPGEVITQSLDIRNDSSQRLELQLAAVDAVTGPLGGVSYGLAGEEATRTATWIDLTETSLSLEPGASAVVPFTVTLPPDPGSGEHLAGISVAALPGTETSGVDPTGDTGFSVDVRTRRVLAVQVNLPGPATPELVINAVTPAARPDGLYLEIGIEHTGTALTSGTGTISATEDDFTHDFTLGTFVPATSIAYPVKWEPGATEGEHPVHVEIRYGDQVATWDGTFTFGEEVLDELADREVGGAPRPDEMPLPLALAAAALALILLAVLTIHRLRKPRHART